jgi:hypothetical protein
MAKRPSSSATVLSGGSVASTAMAAPGTGWRVSASSTVPRTVWRLSNGSPVRAWTAVMARKWKSRTRVESSLRFIIGFALP